MQFTYGVNLNLEYARPLTRTPDTEGDKDGRLLFFLGVNF